MIKIGLCGIGKTGLEIKKTLINNETKYKFTGSFSKENNIAELEELCVRSDIIIDFSHPDILTLLLKHCSTHDTGLVIGTTGLTADDFNRLQDTSRNIPIFYSSNMSIGANVLAKIATDSALILGKDFDITVTDFHHRYKKDAPSGTALMIAKAIEDKLEVKKKIDFTSIRAGGNFGEHEVIFASDSEIITLKHQALNREVFAHGAIMAAEWLQGKKVGLYSINDMLY